MSKQFTLATGVVVPLEELLSSSQGASYIKTESGVDLQSYLNSINEALYQAGIDLKIPGNATNVAGVNVNKWNEYASLSQDLGNGIQVKIDRDNNKLYVRTVSVTAKGEDYAPKYYIEFLNTNVIDVKPGLDAPYLQYKDGFKPETGYENTWGQRGLFLEHSVPAFGRTEYVVECSRLDQVTVLRLFVAEQNGGGEGADTFISMGDRIVAMNPPMPLNVMFTPTDTADIDVKWSQVGGDGRPEDNATFGATWGHNIFGDNLPESGATVNHTFVQSYPPVEDVRDGDIWIDTDQGNMLHVYEEGMGWIARQDAGVEQALILAQESVDAIDGKINTYYQPVAPSDPEVSEGDLWFDTDDGNHLFVYRGGVWITAKDDEVARAIEEASTALAKVDGKVTTYFTEYDPYLTGEVQEGDLWYDNNNKALKRWNSAITMWDTVSNFLTLTSELEDDARLGETALWEAVVGTNKPADGATRNNVFIQAEIPHPSVTKLEIGDTWIDIDDGNKYYAWDGFSWVARRDIDLDIALEDLSAQQIAIDGKVTTFYQIDAPSGVGEAEGDIWFDTDDGNAIYIYEMGVWVNRQDDLIAEALNDAATAQATADGKVTTYFSLATPSEPVGGFSEGDLWYSSDTKLLQRFETASGTWEVVSNSYTNTSELVDDAKLGESALWGSIGGDGKPEDYATYGATQEQIRQILDLEYGKVYSDEPSLFSSMGLMSARVAMQTTGNTYWMALEDGTKLYQNGVEIISADSGQTGIIPSATVSPGDIFETNGKPMPLVSYDGYQLPPICGAGKNFGFYCRDSVLGVTAELAIYSPYSDATVTFRSQTDVPMTVASTATDTVVIPRGVVTPVTLVRSLTEEDRYKLTSDTPVLAFGKNGNGQDRCVGLPASRRTLLSKGSASAILGFGATTVNTSYASLGYYEADGPIVGVAGADAAGSDCEASMPVVSTGHVYCLPHDVNGYIVNAVEPTIITVKGADGSVYAIYDFSDASPTNPRRHSEGSVSGVNTSPILIPGGATLTGTGRFAVRTNIFEREYQAFGYNVELRPIYNAESPLQDFTREQLALAKADSAAALADLADIADDNKLHPAEKLTVVQEYNQLLDEQATLNSQADDYGITTQKTAYNNALTTLTNYLTGLSPAYNDSSQVTEIVRLTWQANWIAVNNAKQVLLGAIADAAATMADWENIIGDAKPADYADVTLQQPFASRYAWTFRNNTQGWTANAATLTPLENSILITAANADPKFKINCDDFSGRYYNKVRARIKWMAGSWQGTLYYQTAGHGESSSFNKTLTEPAFNEWVVLEWDMENLTNGGTDWVDNTITQLRFDFCESADSVVEVDWVAIGNQFIDTVVERDIEDGATYGADETNLNIGLSANQLENSSFVLGVEPWVYSVGAGFVDEGSLYKAEASNVWQASPGTGVLRQNGSDPNGYQRARFDDLGIIEGQRYEASMYYGAHRCDASIRILWYDASGTFLSSDISATASTTNAQGAGISGYSRIGVFGTAPAGARTARVVIHKEATKSGTDSYLFFSRCYFGEALPAQTTLSKWAPSAETTYLATAQAAAEEALSDLSDIAADDKLHPSEKLQVVREYNQLVAEQSVLAAQAASFSITTELNTFNLAVSDLDDYLQGMTPAYDDTTQVTSINRAAWQANWEMAYSTKYDLMSAISDAAAERATWASVVGDGKPDDYATATLPSNLILNGFAELGDNRNFTGQHGPDGQSLTYSPNEGMGGSPCFKVTSQATHVLSDRAVPVDINLGYESTYVVRSNDSGVSISAGIVCYDSQGRALDYHNVHCIPSTATTLHTAATAGNDFVRIVPPSGNITVGQFLHFYENGSGNSLPNFSNKEIIDVNKSAGTYWEITFSEPLISNHSAGIAVTAADNGPLITYAAADYETVGSDWAMFSGRVKGVNEKTKAPTAKQFRIGTTHIRAAVLANLGAGSSTTYFNSIASAPLSTKLDGIADGATKNHIFSGLAMPSPTQYDLQNGDIWLDEGDGFKLHMWINDEWVERRDQAIDSALSTAAAAEAAADGAVVSFYQAAVPTGVGEKEGDIWFDTDDGNKLYIYTSGVWVDNQDAALAEALDAAAGAQATADGKVTTYFTETEPTTNLSNGDLWYQASTSLLRRWDAQGNDWDTVSNSFNNTSQLIDGAGLGDSALWENVTGTGRPADNATVNHTFTGPTAPTLANYPNLTEGDLWLNTAAGNRVYAWENPGSGYQWVSRQDGDILSARQDLDGLLVESIQSLLDNADTHSRVVSIEQTVLDIQEDSSLASTVSTLQTQVQDNQTTIQQHTQSLNGIRGEWGVNVDNNGHISGINLLSELVDNTVGVVSSFTIVADKFSLVKPGASPGTPRVPFAIDAQTGEVAIQGNLIVKGSVGSSAITPSAIDATLLAAGAVGTSELASGAVTSTELATNSVTAAKLLAQAVSASKILTGTITATQIGAGAIGNTELADGSVDSGTLANNAVTANKIVADAISATHLADGSVGAAAIVDAAINANKIATGAITTIKIADNAISAPKIAALAIDTSKIAADAINAEKIAAAAVETAAIAVGAVGTNEIAANAVTAAEIVSGAITTAKIATGAITSGTIASNAITSGKINALAITADKIAANAVTAGKINAGAVTAGTIAAGAVTATELAANAVTAAKISAGTITATEIAASAITATEIATNAVTSDKIIAGAIVAAKISAGAIETDKLAAGAVVADKIAANAITASKINVTNLSSVSASMGTVTGGTFQTGSTGLRTIVSSTLKDATANKFLPIWVGSEVTPTLSNGIFRIDQDGNAYFGGTIVIADDQVTSSKISSGAVGSAEIGAGAVGSSEIADNAVGSSEINTGAVGASEIATGAVNTAEIAAGAVTATEVAANTLTAGQIAAGAVNTSELAANAVTATEIKAGAVGAIAIAAGSITAAEISAGAISTTELAADSVTATNIVTDAINSNHIQADTIKNTHIYLGAVGNSEIAAGAVGSSEIASGAVTSTELADLSVSGLKIQTDAIDGGHIQAGVITGDLIAANTIVAGNIASNAVTASKISVTNLQAISADMGTLTAGTMKTSSGTGLRAEISSAGSWPIWVGTGTKNAGNATFYVDTTGNAYFGGSIVIGTGQVTSTNIGIGAVGASEIATGAVGSDEIASSAVTNAKLGSGAVTAAKVTTGTLTASQIATGTITANELAANSVSTSELAAGAITAVKIGAGVITANEIKAETITAAEIAANSITSDLIAANAINSRHISVNSDTGVTKTVFDAESNTPLAIYDSATNETVFAISLDGGAPTATIKGSASENFITNPASISESVKKAINQYYGGAGGTAASSTGLTSSGATRSFSITANQNGKVSMNWRLYASDFYEGTSSAGFSAPDWTVEIRLGSATGTVLYSKRYTGTASNLLDTEFKPYTWMCSYNISITDGFVYESASGTQSYYLKLTRHGGTPTQLNLSYFKGEVPSFIENVLNTSTNGYWKDKDTGFLIQWGSASVSSNSNTNITFPIAFPNGCRSATISEMTTQTESTKTINLTSKGTTYIGVRNNVDVSLTVQWIAVGY